MKKILAPGINCFQSFLACMLDDTIINFASCSTINDDWKEQTEKELGRRNLYIARVNPGLVSQLPDGALIGAYVNGINNPHILIARCFREGPRHYFKIEHDPSGKRQAGVLINPSQVVLLCKLDQ